MIKNVLEIFKPGHWVDTQGRGRTFTKDEVQEIADNYDPALFAAPIVVGHPKVEDPAYGRVASLSFDDILKADTDQVDPAFAEIVNNGRYNKISASLFPPTATNNPTPGKWYLRHVGFLGATAPAVSGLKPASFAGDSSDALTFEFASDEASTNRWAIGSVLRNLREWLIEKFDTDTADRVVPKWAAEDAENATRHPVSAPEPKTESAFANPEEPPVTDKHPQQQSAEFADRETQLRQKETDLDAREQRLAAEQDKQRQTEITNFAGQLVDEGKLLPAEQPGLVAFMTTLKDDQSFSFAEGDTTVEKTPDNWLRGFLQGLPERVDFAERGKGEDMQQQAAVSYAAPSGYTVDPDRLAVHNRALAYQQQHRCDYGTALAAVGQ